MIQHQRKKQNSNEKNEKLDPESGPKTMHRIYELLNANHVFAIVFDSITVITERDSLFTFAN